MSPSASSATNDASTPEPLGHRFDMMRSYVIRIWREDEDPDATTSTGGCWRGSITDVETGERIYVGSLHTMCCIMAEGIRKIRGDVGWTGRVAMWACRWFRRQK